MATRRICVWTLLCSTLTSLLLQSHAVDLLQRYPTQLTSRDENLRSWDFSAEDIYRISQFNFEVGKDLKIQIGAAGLGIGHCADGAVWAIAIPDTGGILISKEQTHPEPIAHVWLRFHPSELNHLFPPETVTAANTNHLVPEMSAIAQYKIVSSWQGGGRALIPPREAMTVDVDTKDGFRRFFAVDKEAPSAAYVAAFEKRALTAPPAFERAQGEEAFDQLWNAFDSKYAMFADRPGVDWQKLRTEYRPKALASQSTYEFAGICADMLKHLRDLHVGLTLMRAYVPIFDRPRTSNANPAAQGSLLGKLKMTRRVRWAVTAEKIGFMAIDGWDDPDIPAQCGDALENMRDTRGLIIDVRLNGGGSEPLAKEFAGRFLHQEFTYAFNRMRNGPNHSDLTEKIARRISPKGPWRYDRPVVLLIGQKCMSSNESFIGMMTGDPLVTTMGDHTAGSSGNPTRINLPLALSVSVPQWVDYLPDGTPLNERGFQPQVLFAPGPGAFQGKRDDLLAAALDRLRKEPLPEKPIAGPGIVSEKPVAWYAVGKPASEADDPSRPRVVAVTPPDGAEGVALSSEIHVRFDRPMNPFSLSLAWEKGGFLEGEFPNYDPEKFEFTVPMRFPPGVLQRLSVKRTSNPSEELFKWRFRTKAEQPPAAGGVPKVISISPASGSSVPLLTFVDIQFDQPMSLPEEAPPYVIYNPEGESAALISRVQFDPERNSFRLPLVFPPKKKVTFTVSGFRTGSGVPAEPIHLEYIPSGKRFSPAEEEKIAALMNDAPLAKVLNFVMEKRAHVMAISERIQTLSLGQWEGLFKSLDSKSSLFKWQYPGQCYADISEIMRCSAFRIGSDGTNWWWHYESAKEKQVAICPSSEMGKVNLLVCDPFSLMRNTPAQAATDMRLSYLGIAKLSGLDYHLIEAWDVKPIGNSMAFGHLTRWWLNPQTGLPAEVIQYGAGGVERIRFLFQSLNERLPADAFAVPEIKDSVSKPPETLDRDYTTRFVNVRDGSDGRMSVRWGKQGPKGQSSSGLN